MATLINPFAVRLNEIHGKNAYRVLENVAGNATYRRGNYTCWKQDKRFYNTCYKNIIVSQTVGVPKKLIEALHDGRDMEGSDRHHIQSMREAQAEGIEYAKKNNIEIINI